MGNYAHFSTSEMLTEIADLHSTLAEVEMGTGFSPAARRGVRETILRQLLAIDEEHARRASATTAHLTRVQVAA
jgi:hypothetical protein